MLSKISKNLAASFICKIIGSGIAVISIGLIARALGDGGFGEYTTVIAYLTVFQLLSDFGLQPLLAREIAQHPKKESDIISSFLSLKVVLATSFLVGGLLLVAVLPYSSYIKIGIIATSVAFLSMSLTQIMIGVLQKHIQIYKSGIIELVGRLIGLSLVITFFVQGGGVYNFLIAFVVANVTILILHIIAVYKVIPFRLVYRPQQWKATLKTALPIAASLVFTLLYFRADTILLSLMQDSKSVGLYNISYKVLEVFIFFPAMFFGLMLPIIARQAKNTRYVRNMIGFLCNTSIIIVLPFVAGGVLVSASMLKIIGGDEFLPSITTLQILFGAMGVIVFGNLFGSVVIALDLQKKAMIAYALGFVFNVIANILVIPHYSYEGVAFTTLITEILVTLVLCVIVYKKQAFRISYQLIATSCIATASMVGILLLGFPTITEPLSIPLLLGVLFVGMLVYGIVNAYTILTYVKKAPLYFSK